MGLSRSVGNFLGEPVTYGRKLQSVGHGFPGYPGKPGYSIVNSLSSVIAPMPSVPPVGSSVVTQNV